MACRVLRGRIRMRKFSHFLTDQNVEKHFFFFFLPIQYSSYLFVIETIHPYYGFLVAQLVKKTTCNVEDLAWEGGYGGFPSGSDGEESACNSGDPGSIPGSGRSPGEGNGNPLQYSCLENSMDRGAWQDIVHGIAKSWT